MSHVQVKHAITHVHIILKYSYNIICQRNIKYIDQMIRITVYKQLISKILIINLTEKKNSLS